MSNFFGSRAKPKRAYLPIVAVALFSLILCTLGPVTRLKAAVPLTDHGVVSLNGELYVTDTFVIKDGTTYKMWYTHGLTSISLTDIANRVGALLTQTIINDISTQNLDVLLNDIAGLDATDVYNLVNCFSTLIGYATSNDGISWTVVNRSVLAGTGGGAWNVVGTPTVIKESPTSYKMWYTASTSTLTLADIATILGELHGTAAQRKQAIISLLESSATSIRYATSPDGIGWTPVSEVLTSSSGSLLDSVSSPSVINDGGTYRMWYTNSQTTLTDADLDGILADPVNYGVDNFLQNILSKVGSSIGYATSTNGTTWIVSNPSVIAGTSGAWGSTSMPSVLKKGTGYEMWYTRAQTNLDQAGVHTLLHDLLALSSNLSSLMTTLKNGSLVQFITELDNLISGGLTAVRADAANTSSVVTYATSADGLNWTVQNSNLFVGRAIWNSISAPTVISDNGTYKMWYARGMITLSAQNILDLIQGTTSPVGYATGFNLVAETAGTVIKDTDNMAGVQISINRGEDSNGNATATVPGGINSYQALLTYNSAGIQIIQARGGSAPFNNVPTFNSSTGVLSATATLPLNPNNSPIAKLIIRLNGSATTPYTLGVTFQNIMAGGATGMNVPAENTQTFTFLRGDANGNGTVSMGDAMFIAQYLVGLRPLTDLNIVNSASVKQDGTAGDVISIADAMFIAQYLVGLRNANYN